MILHEHDFANLAGDGRLAGDLQKAIAAAFGSTARRAELFRASAFGLGGGSEWVILDFNFRTGHLRSSAVEDRLERARKAAKVLTGQPMAERNA